VAASAGRGAVDEERLREHRAVPPLAAECGRRRSTRRPRRAAPRAGKSVATTVVADRGGAVLLAAWMTPRPTWEAGTAPQTVERGRFRLVVVVSTSAPLRRCPSLELAKRLVDGDAGELTGRANWKVNDPVAWRLSGASRARCERRVEFP